jgi:hypothetical protein
MGTVIVFLTLTCGGMVYFTYEGNHHSIAAALSATKAARSAAADAKQTAAEENTLKGIVNTNHAASVKEAIQEKAATGELKVIVGEVEQTISVYVTNTLTRLLTNGKTTSAKLGAKELAVVCALARALDISAQAIVLNCPS